MSVGLPVIMADPNSSTTADTQAPAAHGLLLNNSVYVWDYVLNNLYVPLPVQAYKWEREKC